MAIEYFAGDMIATAGEMAIDVANNIGNNLNAVAEEYAADKRSQAAFQRGAEAAQREWTPKYDEALKDGREGWSRAVSSGQKVAHLEKRLINEVREKVFLDCQRFGYSQAIGMLKGFCDYANHFTKDHRDNVMPFHKYYHHTGEIVPLYEEPTVTNLKLSDFPDINDEAHKSLFKGKVEEGHGVLSVYEECYLRGFWHRATQLWKNAEAENDTVTLEAMQSLQNMKGRCFWQKPYEARGLHNRQVEGYRVVREKMIPYWKEEIKKRTKFIKENNLTDRELSRMMMDYSFFEDRIREKMKEEEKKYAEKGIDKEYFV